jgi:SAM-dependent methyltransferase
MVHRAASIGFDRVADAYERGRPSYPLEAIDWLTNELRLGPGKTVVDLAAGTGKLARLLVPSGARVVAVEPVAGMREVLVEALPAAEVREGTAEAIPLPPRSADAVTVGQAFHWFDGERALAEIHRVLSSHGRLALVWNLRDLGRPLQARLEELLKGHRGDTPSHRSGRWRDAFATTTLFVPASQYRVSHRQQLDADGFVDRVGSISFIAALGDTEREAFLRQVRALAETCGGDVRLDYETEILVYKCTT